MTSYPAEDILNPRAFIHGSNGNTDVLILQSTTSEARLRFINDQVDVGTYTPGYVLTASNEHFTISKDDEVISLFTIDQGEPTVRVPGTVLSEQFKVSTLNYKKSVVLADNNSSSTNQFAGFGYVGGQLHYQIPSDANIHRFMVAADAYNSYELMRVQRSATGVAQVGIGLTTPPLSNIALQVDGDVMITGTINFNDDKYIQLDSNTNKVPLEKLPEKLLYLNNENQVDQSFLPQQFNFQYLKAQKNVGIGTKIPLQKLHVNGSTYVSDRSGIGVSAPISRLHVVEDYSQVPTVLIENNVAGHTLRCMQGENIVLDVDGSVGIGTYTTNDKALQVNGDVEVMGKINAYDLQTNRIEVTELVVPSAFKTEFVFNDDIPQQIVRYEVITHFNNGIVLKDIFSDGDQKIIMNNDRVTIDGNLEITGNVVGQDFQATSISTAELDIPSIMKTDVIFDDGASQQIIQNKVVTHFNEGIKLNNISSLNGTNEILFDTDIFVDGNISHTGQINSVSDARLKSDVKRIESSLSRVEKLCGYTYVMRGEPQRRAGVLAQEVEGVLPEAVTTIDDVLTVSYNGIVAMLVECVKELHADVKAIKTHIGM